MATSTMRRQQTGNWSSIFPNKQTTEQQSALFVKKLLAVAISNITYLRTIFPEHAFGNRRLDDVCLKILRDDSACPGACQVIQWVKGCFDALDKKYLRMILIGIYTDANDPSTVVETYTFRFDYTVDGGITIFRNKDELTSAHSAADIRKATIQLLRTVVVLTQNLKPLPDDVMMSMKLFYYDEVTPEDYEPPGFKSTTSNDEPEFRNESVSINVGDVSTAFHTVRLRIRTDKTQFETMDGVEESDSQQPQQQSVASQPPMQQEQSVACQPPVASQPPMQQEQSIASQPSVQEHSAHEQLAEHGSASVAVEPTDEDQASVMDCPPDTNPGSTSVEEEEEDNTVRCPCDCNEDDGLMIRCGACTRWQHAICFGFLEVAEVPELHICEQCAQISEGRNNTQQCTDTFLQSLSPAALQATCLWRRTLAASLEFTRIIPQQFSNRLGVEVSVAQGLINRLEKESYIKSVGKGRRISKTVDKKKVQNEGIPKYFENKKAASGNTSVDEVTEQASALDLSEPAHTTPVTRPAGSRSRKTKAVVQDAQTDGVRRRSPRLLQKRVRSAVNQDVEFDLSQEQDAAGRTQSKRRKKTSVVSKSILV